MIVLALGHAPVPAADPPANFEREIEPIVDKYCADCHGGSKSKGKLNLKKYHSATEAMAAKEVFAEVGKRVKAGEMPPENKPKPTDKERALFVRWSEHVANPPKTTDCNQLANDQNTHFYRGHVMSRRLTRAEYANCVRDLTGVDLPVNDLLPADGAGGEGFDTTGDTLYVSAIHLEKYLAASRTAIEGAFAKPESRTRILAGGPTVRAIVASFARKAWRRPVAATEVDRLLSVYDEALPRDVALRRPLQAVLLSPNFMFLVEPLPAGEGIFPLDPFALASRLSFFLWSTMPDEELLKLAEIDGLKDGDTLRRQVRRMLADPRAKALGENFGIQWLGLAPLGMTTRPDAQRFPEFDAALALSMRAEAVAFVAGVFRGDRPITEFIDCDYAWLDERLARHYGIAGVSGPELRHVKLEAGQRGGVLGLGAVLTVTSYPLRTSPVLRGKWVLEEVLGAKVPPPPPGAGELPRDDHSPDNLTLRQRMEQHRNKPECASCHARMDPLGFGLENFDAIGRWRTTQNGQPIDSVGVLPSGEKFTTPAELKAILLKRRGEFARHFSRKMLGYALGRDLDKYDNCVIDDCVRALEANAMHSSALVEQVVLSYPFRNRYYKH